MSHIHLAKLLLKESICRAKLRLSTKFVWSLGLENALWSAITVIHTACTACSHCLTNIYNNCWYIEVYLVADYCNLFMSPCWKPYYSWLFVTVLTFNPQSAQPLVCKWKVSAPDGQVEAYNVVSITSVCVMCCKSLWINRESTKYSLLQTLTCVPHLLSWGGFKVLYLDRITGCHFICSALHHADRLFSF